MKYRKLAGVPISEVGLGAWQLGSADYGRVSEEQAMAILSRFVELGGNFIDTADVYGGGQSEKYIGKFVRETRSKVFIADKLGRRSDSPFGWPQNFSYDSMREHVEDSLYRLGVDSIFLEQLHCIPKDELHKGVVFDHLRRLQDEGLIDNWGVSVESVEEAKICLEQYGLSSIQIIFNLFRQNVAEELFDLAKSKGVGIIARVPLASGLLSGKFTVESTFSSNDHRNYNADGAYFNVGETFSGVPFTKGVGFSEDLKKILPDGKLAQHALRWILDHEAVSTVIPGATSPGQVHGNMEVSEMPALSADVMAKLRAYYDENIYSVVRGEI
jgi:aryl-alcohol dehydrogenase-like predicted oxidoreductase